MTTYSSVKAQIAKLEKQAEVFLKQELEVVIKKAKALIEQYGLTAEDLGLSTSKAAKPAKGAGKKVKAAKPAGIPLYADPVSGKTWTGKGKQPNFIVDALKKGKSKEDFLISKAAVAPAPEAKVAAVAKVVKAVKAVKATKKEAAPAKAPKAAAKAPKEAKPAKKVAAKKAETAAPVAAS